MTNALYKTDLPLPNRRQGKVRDIYELPADSAGRPRLLIVATDRLSAYDVVMPTAFPGKGRLLTSISMKWFRWIEKQAPLGIKHHVLSTASSDLPVSEADRKALDGSIMVCRRSKVVLIECVARGYITGSGWKEYKKDGTVCGIKLPAGLRQCDKLPEPIFTPATKEDVGHDENITFERACELVGEGLMTRLRKITLDLYKQAHDYAKARGIIIADTKFEFGHAIDAKGNVTDELLLIDEVLTPDSSRFWPLDKYEPGRDQESFDKQYVRNHLETLVAAGKWDKTPPGPEIPADIVRNTIAKYQEAHDKLFS
ncbi:MAG: phosphoribosylaminoimidazolesuccinocarboxamide synthase [Phycisphaerales bacterium]|nr:phosphoribosylaminoimidazolesuccinocarboxamide synthase [Phycisphaerales bacterium]